MSEISTATRLTLLALGAVAGLVMAAFGLVDHWGRSGSALPDHAIARVGEQIITLDRYLQVAGDLAADRRSPLDAGQRQFVLDRLIDEELLIMRGIEMGLAGNAPQVRKSIASVLIAQIAAEAVAQAPDEAALRALYDSDPEFFTATARYQVRWLSLRGVGEQAGQRAADAYQQLSVNIPLQEVMRSTGLQLETVLPDAMLPLTKLADYLGSELAQQAAGMQPGKYSAPIAAGSSFHILYMVDRQAGVLPAFEQARPVVAAEYLRRESDKALRRYLAWLRQRAEIMLDQDMVNPP